MKDWVPEFLRAKGDQNISIEELERDLQIPVFCYRRLAGCFRILTPRYYDRECLYFLIGYVLGNLPKDIFQTVMALKTTFVASENFGSVTRLEEGGTLVTLNRILGLRDAEAIGVIAHELAHAVGGELFGSLYGVDDLESRADDLASQWGFKEEIESIRTYLKRKGEKNGGEIGKIGRYEGRSREEMAAKE